jgi:cytoskeletal protein RodZ
MPESFGRYLKRERELREIPLEEISRRTKVKLAALVALEEDRFSDLPPVTFVRGFIRSYAECVGLDPRDAILRLDHFLHENFPEKAPPPAAFTKPPLPSRRLVLLCFGFLLAAFFF